MVAWHAKLVAFVEPSHDVAMVVAAAAAAELPAHMVPSRCIRVPALPRTSTGKVDRRSLLSMLREGGLFQGADGAAEGAPRGRAAMEEAMRYPPFPQQRVPGKPVPLSALASWLAEVLASVLAAHGSLSSSHPSCPRLQPSLSFLSPRYGMDGGVMVWWLNSVDLATKIFDGVP